MKKYITCSLLVIIFLVSACSSRGNNIYISDNQTMESDNNKKEVKLEPYPEYEKEGQFKIKIVALKGQSYEDIKDDKVLNNISKEDKNKYFIYIEYIFEDETIDSDIDFSSYSFSDYLPDKVFDKDSKQLKYIQASNMVDIIDSEKLKDNQQGVRAVFVSDTKIDSVKIKFLIVDKFNIKNKADFDLNIDQIK